MNRAANVYQGARNNVAGQAGEASVERAYIQRRGRLLAQRWCGMSGEVDLVIEEAGAVVFVEVKTSKTHDLALQKLRPAQQRRIMSTALEYLAATGRDMDTDMRFDLATVDAMGDVQILENALAA
jgi:putative endonuclease